MTTATAAARKASSSATAIRTAILIISALSAACDDDRRARPGVAPDQRAHDVAREMQRSGRACEPSPTTRDRAACERACELGHSNSCAQLGAIEAAAGRRERALVRYGEACRGGSGVGCEGAARLSGDPTLYAQARRYHRVHCEQGYARSCAQLAELHSAGRGGPASASAADYYRDRACALGWPGTCARP